MSTQGDQGNDFHRSVGFLALLGFILLIIAATVLPIYAPGYPYVTVITLILSILGSFIAVVQAFPKLFTKLTLPRIPRATAFLASLLILSFVFNAFLFTRLNARLIPTPLPLPPVVTSTTPNSTQNTLSSPTSGIDAATKSKNPFPSYIPGQGTLIMFDPLLDNSRGYHWQESNDPSGSCGFTASGYHITASNYYHSCLEYSQDFTNFVFEVQMMPPLGSAGGLSFRNTGVNGAGYDFDLGASGSYSMNRVPDNLPLRASTVSPSIVKGQASYLVDIEVSGNRFTLYVDKKKIDSVTDDTYSHGYLGFYVTGDGGTAQTEVTFANVRVWTLA